MRDFAAFVSLSSRTSPFFQDEPARSSRRLGECPWRRASLPLRSGWPARKGSLELGAISLGLVAQLVRARA